MISDPESTQSWSERRTMRRFDMRLPALVKFAQAANGATAEIPEREILTETQNVSARGIFFYVDRPITQGTRVAVTMTFPPHITMTDPVRVRFVARVVRVEAPLPVSRIGVAAFIEEHEFLRSDAGSGFLNMGTAIP
jgi:PilZ domain